MIVKLRNKKTGVLGVLEATTYHGGRPDNIVEVYEMGIGAVRVLAQYNTLDELLEEWEDYKPKEPLIKDEKIRKAIRAWAEVNDIDRVWHEYSSCWIRGNGLKIEFENEVVELEQGTYTISELCGEEEE